MKKFFVPLVVLAMLAIMVTPAFAAGGPPGGGNGNGGGNGAGNGSGGGAGIINKISKMPYALTGTIASLDPAALTITVTVVAGNKLVKPYLSQNLTLVTTATTQFLLRNPDGVATPITYGDLAVGQNVSALGQLADGSWVVARITVGADLTCLP